MNFLRVLIPALMGAGAMSAQAEIPEPRRLGKFKSWQAFERVEHHQRVCYARAEPSSKRGKYRNRDKTFVTVTYRPERKYRFEVTVIAGYTYRWASTVRVNVDGRRFRLFTDKDLAWIATPRRGEAMVRAMRKGRWMVLRGRSVRGTKTTDTYSLTGFTRAQKAIVRACKRR